MGLIGVNGVNGVNGATDITLLPSVTTSGGRALSFLLFMHLPVDCDCMDADVDAGGGVRGTGSSSSTSPILPALDSGQAVIGGASGKHESVEFRFLGVDDKLGNDSMPDSDLEPWIPLRFVKLVVWPFPLSQ
jgi:hypothetical protein